MRVPPAVRRRYYERSWGNPSPRNRYEGTTFDEYLELMRLRFPLMTPAGGAACAAREGRPDLSAATTTTVFPVPPPDRTDPDWMELAAQHVSVFVQKSGPVDLEKLFGKKKPRILTCHTNVVSGWKALRSGDRWLHLHFYRSKTEERAVIDPPVPCGLLHMEACDDATVRVLLSSVDPVELELTHTKAIDLSLLGGRARLESLAISAPLVEGVATLESRSLRDLSPGPIASADEIVPLVKANAATLETLSINTRTPFGPDLLPALPRLRVLVVPEFDELREEWIDFASERATFGINFWSLGPEPKTKPKPKTKTKKTYGLPLESWEGHVAPKPLAGVRALLAGAAKELAALGAKATATQQKAVLRRCVEGLNALDAAQGHFIQTIEAEDLSEAIDALAAGTKLKKRTDVADDWRDW